MKHCFPINYCNYCKSKKILRKAFPQKCWLEKEVIGVHLNRPYPCIFHHVRALHLIMSTTPVWRRAVYMPVLCFTCLKYEMSV